MSYGSEAAKVRDLPQVMQYVRGKVLDVGCGTEKITPEAFGVDGRDLPGVNFITDNPYHMANIVGVDYDTVFSSHFLEHLVNPYEALIEWRSLLVDGGHLILYLPCGLKYNNRENKEHMQDIKYEDFLLWFKRCFCGEGKDFRGADLPKLFELVYESADYGDQRYSFVIVAKKV